MLVTLKYGAGNSRQVSFDPGDTIADAKTVATPLLGLPANADATVFGRPQCDECALSDGMTIVFADKPQPKELA